MHYVPNFNPSSLLKIKKSFRLYNVTLRNPNKNLPSPTLPSQVTWWHFKNFFNYINSFILFKKIPLNYPLLRMSQNICKYILLLNFKRLRFFPNIRTLQNEIFTSLSLGLLAKFFNKGKFFLKSKIVYLVTALFLRKILLFANFTKFILIINRKPKYFHEILNALNEQSIATYQHPFNHSGVNEAALPKTFVFPYVLFTNNKPYGYTKVKQKGRLKRKISKKIVSINKILD